MTSTRDVTRFARTEAVPAGNEGGFALVVALLALVGVTALASAGYLLSSADYKINQSHRAATQAFYVADAGLEAYMGSGRIWPDGQVYTHPEGTSRVRATRIVEVDPETSLFRITSVGEHAPPEGGVARRELSTVVIRKAAPFDVNAAFTSPPGLVKQGVAGTVSGYDTSNPADCGLTAAEDLTGLAVPPDGLEVQGGGQGTKSEGEYPAGFEGEPPVDDTQSAEQLLASTGIDWATMSSGGYAEADYVYSQDGYPDFSSDVDPDEWPMVVIDQASFEVRPTQSGRGTLVALGDLTIDGSFTWDGIILVGGKLTSNGGNRVDGAVITGLAMLVGEVVEESQLGNGTWDYRYSSCNVLNALKAIGIPVEEPGTWSESI